MPPRAIGLAGILFGAEPASGAPTEMDGELTLAHSHLPRPVGSRPGAVGERNLRCRLAVHQQPWLSITAGRHARLHGVEMPTAADRADVVAIAAARLRDGKRQRVPVAGLDGVAFGIPQRDDMGRLSTAPRAVIAQFGLLGQRTVSILPALASFAAGCCAVEQARGQQCRRHHETGRPHGQTSKSSGLNSSRFCASTASFTLRTVTAVSYPISAGQLSLFLPRTAPKKFSRCGW